MFFLLLYSNFDLGIYFRFDFDFSLGIFFLGENWKSFGWSCRCFVTWIFFFLSSLGFGKASRLRWVGGFFFVFVFVFRFEFRISFTNRFLLSLGFGNSSRFNSCCFSFRLSFFVSNSLFLLGSGVSKFELLDERNWWVRPTSIFFCYFFFKKKKRYTKRFIISFFSSFEVLRMKSVSSSDFEASFLLFSERNVLLTLLFFRFWNLEFRSLGRTKLVGDFENFFFYFFRVPDLKRIWTWV